MKHSEYWYTDLAELMLEDLREILKAEVDELLDQYEYDCFGYPIRDTAILDNLFKQKYDTSINQAYLDSVVYGQALVKVEWDDKMQDISMTNVGLFPEPQPRSWRQWFLDSLGL